uniref:Agamous-like MADS-box protein AGL62 n=1 Tax=Aegilops tauschii TaxID=37682 RepID=M8B7X5_AEGTA
MVTLQDVAKPARALGGMKAPNRSFYATSTVVDILEFGPKTQMKGVAHLVGLFVIIGFGMPRRGRRLGIAYVHDDKERDVTFFKRRGGLFKSAADLNAITGARVAVILETGNKKMYSFGTPSAGPIVDVFLSAPPLGNQLTEKETSAKIARLQSEVARLDMEHGMEDKRNQLSIQHVKQIQEQYPGMVANLIFSKEQDLNLEDAKKLFNELSRVHEDTRRRLPKLHHSYKAITGGASVIQNMLPSSGPPPKSLKTIPSLVHSMWDHHLPQHHMPSTPLISPPDHNMEPVFPRAPQMFHVASTTSAPQFVSQLQGIPNQEQDLPPTDLHVEDYISPCDTVHPPQNNASPISTTEHNMEASPLLVYSSGNDFVVDDPFGQDQWGFALPDQQLYNGFLGMDGYLGYNGTDVGQSSMGNGGWVDAPPESSPGKQDVDAHIENGGLP